MRVCHVAFLLVGAHIAADARAQPSSLELTRLDGALALTAGLSRSGDHACSQSFASTHATASLTLAIDAGDDATLTIDVSSHQLFGPSPSRYRSGERDFSRTTELTRTVLTGRATRAADAIVLRFARAALRSVRFAGYGTLPLPPPVNTDVAITATCRLAPIDVLPAVEATGERTTRLRLVSCTLDPVPALEGFDTSEVVFGRGVGVRVVTERTMWAPDAPRVVRLMP